MVTKTSDNQIGKFKAASRDLECDEDEARWDDTLKKVTKAPLKKANVPPKYLSKIQSFLRLRVRIPPSPPSWGTWLSW